MRDRSSGGGGADYSRLTAALSARPGLVVTLSWAELDTIVGGLPRSAVDHYPQWWHGDRPNTRAWRAAGFELDAVEVGRWVSFRRTRPEGPAAIAGSSTRPALQAAAVRRVSVDALRGVEARSALLVLPWSAEKRRGGQPGSRPTDAWPSSLNDARADTLRRADHDDSRVLPAWQRYDGRLYKDARGALTDAVVGGRVVIISGGYGVVRANELIGWYDKELRLGDWPPGLLEDVLVAEVRGVGAAKVVAFLATTSQYARLFRRVPWRNAGVSALLVTITGVSGGAMVEVPRRLGQAFTAFWNQQYNQFPAGTSVERLA
jgi:hypothetical protein